MTLVRHFSYGAVTIEYLLYVLIIIFDFSIVMHNKYGNELCKMINDFIPSLFRLTKEQQDQLDYFQPTIRALSIFSSCMFVFAWGQGIQHSQINPFPTHMVYNIRRNAKLVLTFILFCCLFSYTKHNFISTAFFILSIVGVLAMQICCYVLVDEHMVLHGVEQIMLNYIWESFSCLEQKLEWHKSKLGENISIDNCRTVQQMSMAILSNCKIISAIDEGYRSSNNIRRTAIQQYELLNWQEKCLSFQWNYYHRLLLIKKGSHRLKISCVENKLRAHAFLTGFYAVPNNHVLECYNRREGNVPEKPDDTWISPRFNHTLEILKKMSGVASNIDIGSWLTMGYIGGVFYGFAHSETRYIWFNDQNAQKEAMNYVEIILNRKRYGGTNNEYSLASKVLTDRIEIEQIGSISQIKNIDKLLPRRGTNREEENMLVRIEKWIDVIEEEMMKDNHSESGMLPGLDGLNNVPSEIVH